MRIKLKLLLLLSVAVASHAATITSTTSGAANVGSTWVGGMAPSSSDAVVIAAPHSVTFPSGWTCSGSGSLTINGMMVYQGNVSCGNVTANSGSHLQGSGSYTFLMPPGCTHTTCAINLDGTGSPITWDTSGAALGYIGTASGSGETGTFTANYVNWSNLGSSGAYAIQMVLSTTGSTFSIHNSTCTNCGQIALWQRANGSVFSLDNFRVTSAVATNASAINLVMANAYTSGTFEIKNSYVGPGQLNLACSSFINPGLVLQGNFFYNELANVNFGATPCNFPDGFWDFNVLWTNNVTSSVGSNLPAGTLKNTYLLDSEQTACVGENTHATAFANENTTISGWVIESDCGPERPNSFGGKPFEVGSTPGAHPYTLRMTNNIQLPRTAGLGGAAGNGTQGVAASLMWNVPVCNGSSTFCPVLTTDHNTTYASDVGVLYTTETSSTQASIIAAAKDNIIWRNTPGGSGKIGLTGHTLAAGAIANADHNWKYNDNGTGTQYDTAGGNAEYATTPGTGDTSGNPGFVDPTRNFARWCQTLNPSDTTWAACRDRFKSTSASANGYSPSALIAWVRAGFAPQNAATATASSTGGQVGAVSFYTPTLYYSDLINGMCTGGKDNRGHIVTVNGVNFGSTQGTGYVTLTSGGVSQNAAAYLLWEDGKIAFQPGCTFANGTDATITVTTSGGTSNTLPFHIYTGGTIYFADQGTVTGVTGNDSNSGTSPATPFLTLDRCRSSAIAAPGNACYLMPGFVQSNFYEAPVGCSGYLCMQGVSGTADKYIFIGGYPTSSAVQVPLLGGSTQTIVLRIEDARYIVFSNLAVASQGTYEAINLGNMGLLPVHHARFINIDQTMNTAQAVTTFSLSYSSHIQVYGLRSHDLNNTVTGKRVGAMYIADSSHDIDVGWSVFDGSCIFDATPCQNGKQTEVHVTTLNDPMPAPAQPTLAAASGGSLAAGTYEIQLTYGSHAYNFETHVQDATETMPSTSQTIALNGTTQTAITITNPPGIQRMPKWDDGDTVMCNPTLNYRVYACLRSSPGTPCTPLYQGASNFSNTTVYDSISGSNYSLMSLGSGVAAPTCQYLINQGTPGGGCVIEANMRGCNNYNVAIHDSSYIDSPDYAFVAGLNIDANPPHFMKFYNNIVVNSGNNVHPPGGDNSQFDPVCFSLSAPDPQTSQEPQGGTFQVFNNTFFNCGSQTSYWVNGLGLFDLSGTSWNAAFPTLTLSLKNNIVYQPQTNQQMKGSSSYPSISNLVISGSHNLCYGPNNGDHGVCPTEWVSGGGGLNADPLFASTGTMHTYSSGGPYWDGFDLTLQPTSPAIGAGVDLGLGTTLGATRSLYQPAAPSCSLSGTLPSGTVGAAYTGSLTESNCTGGLTYTQSGLGSGACSGLSLNSSTGAITGTPTTAGTCSFTASYDTVSNQAFSMTIAAGGGGGSNGGTRKGGKSTSGGNIRH